MEVCAARQAEAANRAKKQAAQAQAPAKRPILTVKPRVEGEWSEARRRAEALFSTPEA